MQQHGFTTIYFEDLSLREQMSIESQAHTMIARDGSGMTHTLFMPERTSIIEFFPYQKIASCDCYARRAPVVSHRYASLESSSDGGSHERVDIHELKELLKRKSDLA